MSRKPSDLCLLHHRDSFVSSPSPSGSSPSLLGPFSSCVATGSPVIAIFSTSKVVDFKSVHIYFEFVPVSLCWPSCELTFTALNHAYFFIKSIFQEQLGECCLWFLLSSILIILCTIHYTSLHYTTPHYTTPHYTSLHYTKLLHCIRDFKRSRNQRQDFEFSLGKWFYEVAFRCFPHQ